MPGRERCFSCRVANLANIVWGFLASRKKGSPLALAECQLCRLLTRNDPIKLFGEMQNARHVGAPRVQVRICQRRLPSGSLMS